MIKDLILFGGQSNMQGQSECLLDGSIVEGAWEYRYLTDSLQPLRDPCGEDIRADGTAGYAYSASVSGTWHRDNILGSACDGHTTLLPAFCRAYLRTSDADQLTAVHASKGATDISCWMPGTDGYRLLTEKAKAAIQKSGDHRHRAMVWLQGESDAILGRAGEDYRSMLREFGHALEKDIHLTRFGIIRVGRFTMDDRDFAILDAQDTLCREDPYFVMLTRAAADFCTLPNYQSMMSPCVPGHYSGTGLTMLGSLAGEALANLI